MCEYGFKDGVDFCSKMFKTLKGADRRQITNPLIFERVQYVIYGFVSPVFQSYKSVSVHDQTSLKSALLATHASAELT